VAPVDTDTSPDTPVDTDPPVVPIGANALAVGDLVITELMVDPTDCDDFRAEYIELFNTTDDWIELSALTVTIDGRSSLVWAYPELIPPHEHGLLRYSTLSPPSCYAIGWSGLYSADRMDDTGSTVSVSNARGVLDVVVSGLWTWTPGRAKALDPLLYDPIANDDPAAWCDATTSFLGSAYDLGSPYALNTPCPVAPVDTGAADTDATPVVLPPLQVADLRPGDFVITELIVDPNDCDDFRAEYIEFWNTTGRDVDLTGLDVQVDGARSTLRSTAELVRADAFGVLRYSTLSPPTCYSLGWNGLYSAAKMGSGGSTVSLIAPAGVIDTVAAAGWSHQASVSKQLDPAWFDASSNDDPAHWCDSSTVIFGGFSDLGTPGLSNLTCGGAIDTAGAVDTFVAVETSPPTDTYYTGLAGDLVPAPAPVGLRGWLDAWVAWLGL
jgi:hypothetical protein